MTESIHKTVLFQESIDALCLKPGNVVCDATFGGGGHSRAIAQIVGPAGHLIAFDADKGALDRCSEEMEKYCRFDAVNTNFRHLLRECSLRNISEIDGALFDLGLSSDQLEASGRGFTFQRTEPLLMTFSAQPDTETVTATDIVNNWSEDTLVLIFSGFGEERYSKRIAKAIVESRKKLQIQTTTQLVDIIRDAIPEYAHKGKTHFATKVFQALRIAVNDEMDAIREGLDGAFTLLKKGGILAVISFHSVEDRVVKEFVMNAKRSKLLEVCTKSPIVPTPEEIRMNKRSRSAKLRVVRKL